MYARLPFTVALVVFVWMQAKVDAQCRSPENYDEWAIEVAKQENMRSVAQNIADKHGLELIRSISEDHMPEFFHLRAEKGYFDVKSVTKALQSDPLVSDADFQVPIQIEMKGFSSRSKTSHEDRYFKSQLCQCHENTPKSDEGISNAVFTAMNGKQANATMRTRFNDFMWPCQWQLYNCGQAGGPNEYDLDIAAVWEKGITGEGMTVGIVDDGVNFYHQEIAPNYDANASFDFVDNPDMDGPLPFHDRPHGTSCAGAVAMVANNGYCGVGVVYNAKIGALRMNGHHTTDIREAGSIIFRVNYIDVYSNSWGPSDSGAIYRKPPKLTATAFERGCEKGRHGKGSIYVFASGNGGENDHCGADGFSCSIYTIAVAGTTMNGRSAAYSEQCTCIMTAIPSTGTHDFTDFKMNGKMIVPTLNGCSDEFDGTSSVTPLASGIFAMVLQANPKLTWRDVQHLVAHTALVVDPESDDWQINGAGFHVHHFYGFGALNALHIVDAAEKWTNVDKQQRCHLSYPNSYRPIPGNETLLLQAKSDGCQDTENQVLKLEHVQAIISLKAKCRGDIGVRLTSPCGTVSKLMNPRPLDDLTHIVDWPYMSVFHWGEDPRGVWTLEISDNTDSVVACLRSNEKGIGGHLWKFELVLWGVKEKARRMITPPVCNKKNMYDYMEQKNPRDKKYMDLIKGKVESSKSTTIYHEFLEDFSQIVQSKAEKEIRPRPPGPPKKKPYSIPFQRVAMRKWKKSFKTPKRKSEALGSYIVAGYKPHTPHFSRKHFEVVRSEIANRLWSDAETQNDDGEPVTRTDLQNIAMALLKHDRDGPSLFKTKEDAAAVLRSIASSWDY